MYRWPRFRQSIAVGARFEVSETDRRKHLHSDAFITCCFHTEAYPEFARLYAHSAGEKHLASLAPCCLDGVRLRPGRPTDGLAFVAADIVEDDDVALRAGRRYIGAGHAVPSP